MQILKASQISKYLIAFACLFSFVTFCSNAKNSTTNHSSATQKIVQQKADAQYSKAGEEQIESIVNECDNGSLFLVADTALPSGASPLKKDFGVVKYELFNPRIGSLVNFQGDNVPRPKFFRFLLLYNDSSLAASAAEALGKSPMEKDDMELYGMPWYISYENIQQVQIDSLKHLVSAKDYAPNDYYSDVYDQLVFYGSCLTSEEAEALKKLLHDDGKKFKLLKLNYVETDI